MSTCLPLRLTIVALSAVPLPSAMAQSPPTEPPTFAIRADPSVAAKIDSVLATVAEPVTIRLREGETAQTYLRSICGDRVPTLLPLETATVVDSADRVVRFVPCVRQRTNVQIKVRPNNTLEGLAVRLGLRASAAKTLQIVAADGSQRPPGSALALGDTVIAPIVPAWTPFTPLPGKLATTDALVAALSAAFDCAPASEAGCLTPRGVLILKLAAPTVGLKGQALASGGIAPPPQLEPTGGTPPPPPAMAPVIAVQPNIDTPQVVMAMVPPPAAAMPADPVSAGVVATPADPPTLPGAAPVAVIYPASLSVADLAASEVAPEQWPYDKPLVVAILESAGRRGPIARAVIGIADNGLATAAGAPLSPGTFVDTLEPGPPNGFDDDDNGVFDDLIGAGVLRDPYDPMPSGDVAVCPAVAATLPGWDDATREEMSHGSVVTSLASGLALRQAAPGIDTILPKIVFFRMVRDACSEAELDYADGAIEAIDYVVGKTDAKVINLSSFVDAQGGIKLKSRIESLATYGTPLLVVPAGNAPVNLDDSNPCPPCLANLANGAISRGIVAVGAATRDLRPAEYSGRGYGTVRIFAPGEPVGAIDIAGSSAAGFAPSTSYAAPLVSLAAALIGAQGDGDPARLRNRLLLSTWPLYDENGLAGRAGGPIDIGVLDLVKAVAIRYDVVEVIERRAGDRLVRRTYVGDITAGLDGIGSGTAVGGTSLLGLRLSGVAADGSRRATLILRTIDIEKRIPKYQSLSARPSGSLSLHLIDGTDAVLPWAAVIQILFRGRKP